MSVKVKFSRLPQYVAAVVVSIAVLSIGTGAGFTGNTIDVLLAGKYNDIPINITYLSWIISLPNIASILFSFPSGILCDKFGRKSVLLFLTIPIVVGWLLILFANTIDMIFIGRFIIGMGTGPVYVLVTLYASEIAEKQIRAKLASFCQLFMTFGIFLSYVLGYVVDIRLFVLICTILPIVFFIAFLFQVESPIYKVKEGNYKEAKIILRHLRGDLYDVDAELEEIKASLEAKKNKVSILKFVQKRSAKIAILVSLSLVFFQQAGGTIALMYYAVEVFVSSGSTLHPKQATIVVGSVRLLGAFISSIVIDLFPRRTLLFASSFFSSIGLLIIGSYYTMRERLILSEETLSTFGFMPVVGFSIFTIMLSIGLSPMPPIMAAELFPPEIKGFGLSVMGAFSWFLLFLVSRFYNDLKYALGADGTFYMFACVCFVSALFAVFVVPETKGKSLDQIQCELNRETRTESDN